MPVTAVTDLKVKDSATSDVTVVGSGSWATAMTMVLTANGHRVTWYIDRPDIFRHVRRYEMQSLYKKLKKT